MILIASHFLLGQLYTIAHSPAFSHSAYWRVYESYAVAMQILNDTLTTVATGCHVNLENNLQTCKNSSNNRFHSSQCENTKNVLAEDNYGSRTLRNRS
jgi:hypothetical protein